jgi:hypothetical protein
MTTVTTSYIQIYQKITLCPQVGLWTGGMSLELLGGGRAKCGCVWNILGAFIFLLITINFANTFRYTYVWMYVHMYVLMYVCIRGRYSLSHIWLSSFPLPRVTSQNADIKTEAVWLSLALFFRNRSMSQSRNFRTVIKNVQQNVISYFHKSIKPTTPKFSWEPKS